VRKLFAFVWILPILVAGCGGGGGGGTISTPTPPPSGGVTCTAASVSVAEQIPNPVTLFAIDNNGVIIELPSVSDMGSVDPTGSVVFGIGTQSDNSLGSAIQLLADPMTAEITATLNGTAYPSYLDSGSNANFFTSSLATCPTPNDGFYCPSSTTAESATLQGTNSTTLAANFNVANANTLFSSAPSATAFNDLGGPPIGGAAVDLGLPFFFGSNVFTGFEDPSSGAVPYFAYAAGAAPSAPGPPNVETLTVDAGPSGLTPPAVNTGFISVVVCVPGTSTCQTIDHVEVDTGSVGLRLVSSAVTVSLPAETVGGSPVAECLQFADGTTWGSVVTADVQLPASGEKASNVNVQLMGASAVGSVPASCTGTPENTVATFGANGILGVGPFVNDCNSSGNCSSGMQAANYYSCK
jgi:Protein of unknown function (DUF3443)